MDIFEQIVKARRAQNKAALVIVIDAKGSTPRKPGARMLVFSDGATEGTVGGGKVEHVVKEAAHRVIATGRPETITYKLTTQLAMCCGGEMTFFVEPIMPQPSLIVFGCGHVGSAVIRAAAPLGFDIVAVDDMEENTNQDRLPEASRVFGSFEPDELGELPFGVETYVLIVTREHALDQKLLEFCLPLPSRFLGVIGSPRKAKMQRERLAARGFAPESLGKVHCPVGLDVGAETPEEIAIAICAQLIQVRRGGSKFEKG